MKCYSAIPVYFFFSFSIASAQDLGIPDAVTSDEKEYSPFLAHDYPDEVFWGDTHVHTSYSTDASGTTHERVFDVAVSDGRAIGEDGRCREPVGNTVDIEAARFENSIGDPVMTAFWKDEDFDPAQHAFYYVRVLEIPTPRWTTFDARHFGTELPQEVPPSIQERAYSSPIWYTP